MNSKYYPLDSPVEKVIVKIATQFKIERVEVTPFQNARILTMIFGSNENVVDLVDYIMMGDDYNNWNNDDDYLINWVKNKIQTEYPVLL